MKYLWLILLCNCGPRVDVPDGPRYDLSCPCAPKRGVLSGSAYSPDVMWPKTPVNVCFDDGTAEQKHWVQDAISKTWAIASRLQFTWNACGGSNDQDVHIAFGDSFLIEDIGARLNHRLRGLVLGSYAMDEYSIRPQAVYGFGFVMGFTAAQDRVDSPCTNLLRFPGFATRILGPWDQHSVMNDCNPLRFNGGLLSEGDIAGAQQVYGEPLSCTCPSVE